MTKRFRVNDLVKYNYSEIGEYTDENHTDRPLRNDEVVELLNELYEENNKLHQKIFEMRTNIALERTEISKQTYTGKRNEKEYLDAKEFLDEIEKW